MQQEEEMPAIYYAFNQKGNKVIAGPFKSRLKAKPYSKKVGMACRFCGWYSGGNSVCYRCICLCFENRRTEEKMDRVKQAHRR